MTTYPHRIHVHRPHVNLWLAAIVALGAAFVGLGSWVLVDRYAGGGAATQDATTLIDSFFGAASSGDVNAVGMTLTNDAVMWSNGTKIVGPNAIGKSLSATPGLHVERTAPISVDGDFATTATTLTVPAAGLTKAPMVNVFQFKDGKIFRMWVNPPFDSSSIMP